ncbi:hypothetical protein PtrSN002B_009253 [Pyrenophora tritici-repentis]|nr:hypothetical protein PtrV1_13870 [Pyrenophora tritici-repentis]KAI1537957.1 hypothetical protein PtrSN002B_009253 [Pyrenophora tritici-repentis]KAI1570727.1 hypothetical protein PtrEW4_005188 [Pyrenophora tritici-repentis]KAI1583276.1 hypothetical protein PtrEW13061_008892 [Pyrenophora tritici-repentis]PZD33838.1 hypothetical protein A1F96_01962 [Pyrenophora tritici-repentis]
MPFDEEKIRADAACVRDISNKIDELMNPREFAKAASEVYQESKAAQMLRERFEMFSYEYAVTRPSEDECPLEQQCIAEKVIGRPIHTELNAVLAIPKTLMKAESRKAIKVMWRMHGGGGSCGETFFDPWSYYSNVQYVLEKPDMILLEFSYRLWPEASTKDRLNDIASMWRWTFNCLQHTLQLINEHFVVDWGSFCLFGGSFGGEMALRVWSMGENHSQKPPDFSMRSLVANAPTSMGYAREPGLYLGITISPERLQRDREELDRLLQLMPYRIHRSETENGERMFGGPLSSMGVPRELLEKPSAYQMIERMPAVQHRTGKITNFLFKHGDQDKHVDFKDSHETVELLKNKGYTAKLILQPGKGHAEDH